MDKRIEELAEFVKEKFGLGAYELKRHDLRRSVTPFLETEYSLDLEWFPGGEEEAEDGSNPEGTVLVELDVHSKEVTHVTFMGRRDVAELASFRKTEEIARWMEAETGLVYGKQFRLKERNEWRIEFEGIVNGLRVSPTAFISIDWDDKGRFFSYTKYGSFPEADVAEEEEFRLTPESMEALAMRQTKAVEFPDDEKERWIRIYGLEEIYISNDSSKVLPIELPDEPLLYRMDETLSWDKPGDKLFEQSNVTWGGDITPDQAFNREPSPDVLPITDEQAALCKGAVTAFLRSEYPDESGELRLTELQRVDGKIRAVLEKSAEDVRLFKVRLNIILDGTTFEVLKCTDNRPFLQEFEAYERPGEAKVTKEQAFERLRPFLKITPLYMYDRVRNRYRLYGKLDCDYAVNTATGEVANLRDL